MSGPFPRGTGLRVVLRSLLVQGSWNYETLIGTGFAFTALPVLRRLYPHDGEGLRAALTRHAEVFNSHPYLATVAVGAVSRLEADHTDPRVISRFKSALRGSLGSLGDQLVWSAWRPAMVLVGITLFLAGVAWWLSVAVFLLAYNSLNVGLRFWGWRIGTESGLEVGKALREAPLQALARRATEIGAFVGGIATALAVDPFSREPTTLAIDAVAIAAGLWLGLRTRRAIAVFITLVWVLGIASGWII